MASTDLLNVVDEFGDRANIAWQGEDRPHSNPSGRAAAIVAGVSSDPNGRRYLEKLRAA